MTTGRLDDDIKAIYHFRDDLYEVEGIPMVKGRLFIPKSLRSQITESLHSAHQGTAGMKASARQRFWWPGMDHSITQAIQEKK